MELSGEVIGAGTSIILTVGGCIAAIIGRHSIRRCIKKCFPSFNPEPSPRNTVVPHIEPQEVKLTIKADTAIIQTPVPMPDNQDRTKLTPDAAMDEMLNAYKAHKDMAVHRTESFHVNGARMVYEERYSVSGGHSNPESKFENNIMAPPELGGPGIYV